ncbi:MAG: Gfo/Idh/MocA family oxidoreductase [Candidatus Omnitrophica bacterium]|nr:Inositol 2-dehydrogenase/D-chiro-inositol 3-dehydrogenase [bacterium]NUN97486.1 Gfo/Idh/MocA family oxidoreductase [Candidatus Omnitrophota bacterium]
MTAKLRWGILSTGRIAHAFARDLKTARRGAAVAVASRDKDTACEFADEHGIPRAHGTYDDLLNDPEIEAVYIAPPHNLHAEWAIRAAEAGKHILCEKPIGLNAREAHSIIEAARGRDVFLMEAFMYRCHPQIGELIRLLREKAIGAVKLIQANFSFKADFDLDSRLFNPTFGGGGILDVGCYCTSMSRLLAGVATGREFAEPVELVGCGTIGHESGVDECAIAAVEFPGGVLAQLSTGILAEQEEVVRIYGTEGRIILDSPWLPQKEGRQPILRVIPNVGKPRELLVESDRGLYALEADLVAESLPNRQAPWPAMSWEDTLGNMRMLDRWRAAIGLE